MHRDARKQVREPLCPSGPDRRTGGQSALSSSDHSNILAFAPGTWPLLQYFPFMPDFDPSSVPMGVDEEVGGTPASTIRAARKIERRGRPLPQPEQGVGDAWILIAFIVALGLIFVVAAWVLAGSDVPAERESNGQGIIASSTPTRVRPCPGQCPRREGRSYTCLSNGKLERNIGECAGSGGLSHSPAERLGELEFDSQAESSNGSAQAWGRAV